MAHRVSGRKEAQLHLACVSCRMTSSGKTHLKMCNGDQVASGTDGSLGKSVGLGERGRNGKNKGGVGLETQGDGNRRADAWAFRSSGLEGHRKRGVLWQ